MTRNYDILRLDLYFKEVNKVATQRRDSIHLSVLTLTPANTEKQISFQVIVESNRENFNLVHT
jgi:hypothetical protein